MVPPVVLSTTMSAVLTHFFFQDNQDCWLPTVVPHSSCLPACLPAVQTAGPLSIPSPLAPHHSHCQAQPDRPQHTSTVRAAMDLALLDCVSSCQPGKGLLRSGLRVPCSGTASRCSTAVLQGGLWCGPAAATLPLCCSVTWQGAWCRHAMMYIGPSWLSQPAATRRALNLNEFGWSFGLKCCSEGASAVV